jgi:succinate dehydrogenase/fumarate reductase cytochrome b subunit
LIDFIVDLKDIAMNKKNPYRWLRWIARITGTLMVVFTLFIFIGELLEDQQRQAGSGLASFTPLMLVIFVIWGIALAGLVFALWKEGLGGLISLISFILVYVLNLFNKEASMRGNAITIFLIFSIPSILYLVYWKLNKDKKRKAEVMKP